MSKQDQCDHNDESGDLSQWQHLTATYDNDTMLAGDVDPLRPSEESIDHDLLLYNQQYHQQQCATASSMLDDQSQEIDPTFVNIYTQSQSQPTLQHRTGFASEETATNTCQTEYIPPYNYTNQFLSAPNFQSNQSTNVPDRIEDSHWLQVLYDASEPHEFHNRYRQHNSIPAQHQQTTPHKFIGNITSLEQYSSLHGINQSTGMFEPTPINPLLSLINRNANGSDFQPQATSATPEESKPHAVNMNPSAAESVAVSECITPTNRGIDTTNATAQSVFAQEGRNLTFSDPNVLAAVAQPPPMGINVPQAVRSFFSAMDQGEIYNWMTIPVGSSIELQPPYERHRNKQFLLKPLSAYNYFYRDERGNIIGQMSGENDPIPPPTCDFSTPKLKYLLYQHWYVDPVTKKRQHRKSHGKINFQHLSKLIAERWHQLPERGRDFYRAVAQYDTIYYHHHLNIIQRRQDIA
jgi:hypothetical protein